MLLVLAQLGKRGRKPLGYSPQPVLNPENSRMPQIRGRNGPAAAPRPASKPTGAARAQAGILVTH